MLRHQVIIALGEGEGVTKTDLKPGDLINLSKVNLNTLHIPSQNCCYFQCNTSGDLLGCIEGGTYSRDDALVHASVGFDARSGLMVLQLLLEMALMIIIIPFQIIPHGGIPVEGRVHLYEVWAQLHFEVAPQVTILRFAQRKLLMKDM